MAANTIHLEDLIGSRVLAPDGRTAGHVEEVRLSCRDGEYQVVGYLLGTGALYERWSLTRMLLRVYGKRRIVNWDQMDIADPRRPKLLCAIEEIAIDDASTR